MMVGGTECVADPLHCQIKIKTTQSETTSAMVELPSLDKPLMEKQPIKDGIKFPADSR